METTHTVTILSGKKSKSVFDFLTYSREIGFSFSYGEVEGLDRPIGPSNEIDRVSKFDTSLSFAGSLALDNSSLNTEIVSGRTYVAWKLGSHGQVSTEAEQHPPTLADQQSVATPRCYATPWRHVETPRYDVI